MDEVCGLGQFGPSGKRNWMGHGEISPVKVVLNHDNLSTGAQITLDQAYNLQLVTLKVERIGHHDAIERRDFEGQSEIFHLVPDFVVGKSSPHLPIVNAQCTHVLINRMDDPKRAEKLRQGQRERASSCAQVSPLATRAVDASPNEFNVVVVIHSGAHQVTPMPQLLDCEGDREQSRYRQANECGDEVNQDCHRSCHSRIFPVLSGPARRFNLPESPRASGTAQRCRTRPPVSSPL